MNKIELHKQICDKLHDTYVRKNNDYGDSFAKIYREYGLIASSIRLQDKLERFKTLLYKEQKVHDESIKDTLLDLANYAILTLIEMECNEVKK